MNKLIDFIKLIIFFFWNSKRKPVRDSNCRIVPDWRSRRKSKQTQKALEDGTLLRPGFHGKLIKYKKGESPKCFQIDAKAKVVVKQHGKVF